MSMPAVQRWGWLAVVAAGTGLLAWGLGRADEEPRAEAKQSAVPADLRRISANAGGFACLRLADLWDSELGKAARKDMKDVKEMEEGVRNTIGVAPGEIDRVTLVLQTVLPERTEEPVTILTTRRPCDRDRVLAPLGETTKKTVDEKTVYVGSHDRAVTFLDERTFILGSTREVQKLLNTEPVQEGPLSESLRRAAEKHTLVAGLNTSSMHLLLGADAPEQQKPLHYLLQPLARAQATLLIADLDEKLHLKLEGAFTSEGRARAAAKAAGGLQTVLLGRLTDELHQLERDRDMAGLLGQLKMVLTAVQEAPIELRGKTLQTSVEIPFDPKLAAVLAGLPERLRGAANNTKSANNLKQIALAMHIYHDTMGCFPTQAVFGKDGKPLLSWRVMILPYIEQQDLYQQFHLEEPWDSEHNKKLLARMPRTYASPADPQGAAQQRTHYLGFSGPNTVLGGKKGHTLAEISNADGTSNTILVVESSASVPWTKPEDLPFDPDRPLPAIGGLHRDGFLAALCDGSVHIITRKASKETLRNAIQWNDGNILVPGWMK